MLDTICDSDVDARGEIDHWDQDAADLSPIVDLNVGPNTIVRW